MKKLLAILCYLLVIAGFSVEPENYLSRPDILQLVPESHDMGGEWENLKRAHIEVVAQVLALYPGHEIYFLARDSELLYDQAKIILQDRPDELQRIHLLNISRANMRANGVKNYLNQEGISETSLKQGKRILFVDTGFSGTIPKIIESYFPPQYSIQFSTHLLSSSNSSHPSSRIFLSWVNPEVAKMNPGSMHGSIISYEHMPRYTRRSGHFEQRDGKWQAMSDLNVAGDGMVSKEKALQYMESLLHFSQSEEGKELYQKRSQLWRELYNLGQGGSKEQLIERLKLLLSSDDIRVESIVRDFIEAIWRNKVIPEEKRIKLEDVGLEITHVSQPASNKNALIEKYPEWKTVLEDPETGIKELLHKEDVVTIGKMIDTIHDDEFFIILSKILGENDNKVNREIINIVINNKNVLALGELARYTFSQPHTKEMVHLIEKLIDTAIEIKDPYTLGRLAHYTFSQPHTKEMAHLIEKLIDVAIEIKAPDMLRRLAHYTFSQPHTKEMAHLIEKLIDVAIEIKDPYTLRILASSTFSKPHTKEMAHLIEKLIDAAIEIKDSDTLRGLAHYTFSQPHTKEMVHLIAKLIDAAIEIKAPDMLRRLARHTFSQPHTKEMAHLIAKLIDVAIEIKDPDTLRGLAHYTFSQPHTKEMAHLIAKLIDAAIEIKDPDTLRRLALGTFSQTHTKEAELIEKFLENEDWEKLEQELSKLKKIDEKISVIMSIDEFIQHALSGKIDGDFSIETHSLGIVRHQEMIFTNDKVAVHKLVDSNGNEYAIKISRKQSKDLSKERQRVLDYKKHDLLHADYFEGDAHYSIREFVLGERGDDFIKRWEDNGADKNDPKMKKLYELAQRMVDEVFYFGDLSPRNMIWSDEKQNWVIIDSGSAQKVENAQEVKNKIARSFGRKWFRSPPMSIESSKACIKRLLLDI